jgi:transposase
MHPNKDTPSGNWYLPLYRQVQILAGQGVHLDRATLAG